MSWRWGPCVAAAVVLVRCGPATPGSDTGGASSDTGSAPGDDGGALDAGTADAATPDAVVVDAGTPDALAPDAERPDAVLPDAVVVGPSFGPAPSAGTLRGDVRDVATNALLAGARVTLAPDGASCAASGGTFYCRAASGRQTVEVTAPGYLAWRGDVLVAGPDLDHHLTLRAAAAAQQVDPSTPSISAGDVTLTLAGAYSSTQSIAVTWYGQRELGAVSGPLAFSDGAGVHHVLFGVLHADASAQPARAVSVSVPLPSGVDARAVSLREHLSDDTWGGAISPSASGSGRASFTLAHLSEYGAILDGTTWVLVVRSVKGQPQLMASNESRVLERGDLVPSGATIITDASSSVELTNADGALVLSPSSSMSLRGTDAPVVRLSRGVLGWIGWLWSRITPESTTFEDACNDAVGVRGTAFTLIDASCGGAGALECTIEVTGGEVTVSNSAGNTSVSAGSFASYCSGCSGGAVCCADGTVSDTCCGESALVAANECCADGTQGARCCAPVDQPAATTVLIPGNLCCADGSQAAGCCGPSALPPGWMCCCDFCMPFVWTEGPACCGTAPLVDGMVCLDCGGPTVAFPGQFCCQGQVCDPDQICAEVGPGNPGVYICSAQ